MFNFVFRKSFQNDSICLVIDISLVIFRYQLPVKRELNNVSLIRPNNSVVQMAHSASLQEAPNRTWPPSKSIQLEFITQIEGN